MEVWVPVVGWEEYYEVSSEGRVKSLHRRTHIRDLVLKGTPTPGGYLTVSLFKGKRKTTKTIHQLVAEAFFGPCPVGLEVRHLNSNQTDNSRKNIRYGTRSENVLDEVDRGTHHEARKTHCPANHLYDKDNTYYSKTGKRKCRSCNRNRARARRGMSGSNS